MRKAFVLAVCSLSIAAWAVAAAPAAATIKSGSETFDPNQPGPTFGNPSRLPNITIAVTYDDQAGTVTVSETGGDPSYNTGWAWFDSIKINGTNSPEISIQGYWNYPALSPTLTDSAVNGTLAPQQVTKSPDGSTITIAWSDPALAGQPLTFVNIEPSDQPDNNCSCDVEPSGRFYFPGYEPTVAVQNPGAQRTQVGTPLGIGKCGDIGPCCPSPDPTYTQPCPGVQINALETGVANSIFGDDSSSADGTEPAGGFSATGLPPGLTILGGGLITGQPTMPGNYAVTVTATATYDYGQGTASASTTFPWTITAPPPKPKPPVHIPKVPIGAAVSGRGHGIQARPFRIIFSVDGASGLGGTPRSRNPRNPRWGHLRWLTWTSTSATGRGVQWANDCNPACVNGSYAEYPVKILLYAPRYEHGWTLFTRMKLTYTGRHLPARQRSHTKILAVIYNHGYSSWGRP